MKKFMGNWKPDYAMFPDFNYNAVWNKESCQSFAFGQNVYEYLWKDMVTRKKFKSNDSMSESNSYVRKWNKFYVLSTSGF